MPPSQAWTERTWTPRPAATARWLSAARPRGVSRSSRNAAAGGSLVPRGDIAALWIGDVPPLQGAERGHSSRPRLILAPAPPARRSARGRFVLLQITEVPKDRKD